MSGEITNYQCPSCAAPLHFDSGSGKLCCDYCGTSYTVGEIDALYNKENAAETQAQPAAEAESWDTSGLQSDWGDDGSHMLSYSCPSCGAELLCDDTTAATSCPYCGNPSIIPGKLSGALKPEYIIPFCLDKDAAAAALKKHYSKKLLLPKSFKNENHLQEVKGVYVPFWLFDAEADADCLFEGTRSHTHREGDWEVTRTEHFDIRRAGNVSFRRVPADASSKMPDDYMDSIEPFDYGKLCDFSSSYLPGYLADKYDVSVEENTERIDNRCRNSAWQAMRNDISGYDTVMQRDGQVYLSHGAVRYAMLPVWMLTTTWHDKDYLFAMNGQTGKIVGDLPISKGRELLFFLAAFLASAAVFTFTRIGAGLINLIGSFF